MNADRSVQRRRISGEPVVERNGARRRRFLGRVESLEGRTLLVASLAPIPNVSVQQFLGFQVPLNGSGAGTGQTFSVTSDNPRVVASVASGRFLTLQITHASSGGGDPAINGSVVIQLFQDLTPTTVSRIEQLVNSNFYSGKNFHRITNNFPGASDFILQGGSVNGAGNDSPPAQGQPGGLPATGFPFVDEPVQQLAFTGTYQLAMANSGDDSNTSQFFFTTGSPQFLNFQHTIFGQVVSGFDVIDQMTRVQVSGTTPVNPVLISSATLSNTNPNGVVHLDVSNARANETANVTVTATDPSTNTTATQSFRVNTTEFQQSNNSRAFLVQYPTNVTVGRNQNAVFKLTGVGPEPTDTLTYTVQGNISAGSTPVFTPVDSSRATASVDANGVVTVRPVNNFTGTIDLVVGVRDQVDRSNTGNLENAANYSTHRMTVTVNSDTTQLNLQPIALPVQISVPITNASPVQLLGNTANPQSSQTLSYQVTEPPLNGTLGNINQTTGVVNYTPNPGYVGPDFFSYTVTDVGAPTPNLTSPQVSVNINVTNTLTNSVRVIGRVLVVSPRPNLPGVTTDVLVNNVEGRLQVTVDDAIDQLQPLSTAIDSIVVYGTKADDTITIADSVTQRATLDGGHGGRNVINAGPTSSILHGWFGRNRMTGSPEYDLLYGRKGRVKFVESAGNDANATVEPNLKKKYGYQGKLRNAPKTTFFRFVNGRLVATKLGRPTLIQQNPKPPLI
ncbi:MAG: peptidylprolyl isomerase [Isosphaeraceae bacterium]|nr:peptidylprolyl isomerase [Isosphaeraceae bacterium]